MNRTKDNIIEAFWQLLEEKSYSKITVKDIVNRCQINRNTFYYHFQDIPDLLDKTVRNVADEIIRTYAPGGSPNDCLEPIVEQLILHKQAIFHIYRSIQREVFLMHLERVALHTVSEYVHTVVATHDQTFSKDELSLLIRFGKCLLVGVLLDWLEDDMKYDLLKRAEQLLALYHAHDLAPLSSLFS